MELFSEPFEHCPVLPSSSVSTFDCSSNIELSSIILLYSLVKTMEQEVWHSELKKYYSNKADTDNSEPSTSIILYLLLSIYLSKRL